MEHRMWGLRRMRPRDRTQPHRAASSLELLFDLVFVVAVSQAAGSLHGLLGAGQVGQGVVGYLMVFFAVWWAWVNFTWFASAFDTDDWAYRVMTVVQMAGVLVLAGGVHTAVVSYDFTIVTWGYVVMRLAMVGQWLRAGLSDAASRRTAFAFAIGVSIVQVLWVVRLALPGAAVQLGAFFALVAAELAVPVVAERFGATSWHPDHIVDRYGSFTLIVLGEGVLASATAIFGALRAGTDVARLVALAAASLVIVVGMWWVYFVHDQAERLRGTSRGLRYGYAHYVIFAVAGAVSAGIGVSIDAVSDAGRLPAVAVSTVLAASVAVFLVAVWAVMLRHRMSRLASAATFAVALAVLACGLLPPVASAVAVAALMVAEVVVAEVDGAGRGARSALGLRVSRGARVSRGVRRGAGPSGAAGSQAAP